MKTAFRLALISTFAFVFSVIAIGQNEFTVSGYVSDASTGEYILGANVIDVDNQRGVPTNLYGFYSLTLPAGQHTISYSFIGLRTQTVEIELTDNRTINIELEPNIIEGPTVIIEAEKSDNTESTDMGKVDLEVEQIKTLPALLGEVDILKTIQFIPGVQTASEGSSGFYVRGGGPDQNLILLDNAVVYNASHLFGFFSVFNADAVKNIELIKGGMPARYGGRVSSVLDISLKEGNNKRFSAEGGIGLISSRLTLQGPIQKGKSAFIISARRTYIDILTKPFIPDDSNFSGSGYYFYDLNMKVNHRFSDKDQIFASAYFGRDVFNFTSQSAGFNTQIPWGNATASVRWNHLFNDKLFMNTIATFSDYRFEFQANQEDFSFGLFSGIRDAGSKIQFSYYPSYRHEVKFGVDYVFHEFTPNNVSATSGDVVFDLGDIIKNYSHESGIYIEDRFDISDVFSVYGGLRYSYFAHVGPFVRYDRTGTPDPITGQQVVNVYEYGKGELVKAYGGLEPRFSMRWKTGARSSIKLGANRNMQYLHLASLSPTSLPTDLWLPSTDRTRPQIGTQVSGGYFMNLSDNMFEASVEAYYKKMDNLVEYAEGSQPEDQVNDNTDNQLVFGEGESYGIEFFLKKSKGDLNGWIGYTLSKTDRTFEDINNGATFPAKFDRRHDFSLVLNYKINERVKLGGVFIYATGNSITLPVERYFIEGQIVDVYGDRNSFRMAPYHRADLAVTLYPKADKIAARKQRRPERKIFVQSNWTFSVYNLYNRKNPYFIYFANDGGLNENGFQIKAYQVSLFPVLPSVTWNFKF